MSTLRSSIRNRDEGYQDDIVMIGIDTYGDGCYMEHTLLIPIPDLLLYALGFLGDILRFFKIKTNVSSTNLAVLRINNFHDNSKDMNELNIGFPPIERAIQEAIFYFNEK